jgi:F420-dependent oxidoreductase-like protein
MRVCLMIEGQEGVTWDQWVALAQTAERAGFEALFRSDHYLSVQGEHTRGSLDAWATLSALGAVTSRIRLGTMVSPASFRHPSVLAKNVVTADHVSGGRVELGMGAGWLEAEHAAYGFPFHDTRTRMDVLEEQLQIVRGLFGDGSFSFGGEHYTLAEVDSLPKPVQRSGPPLIIGGSGGPRSLRLAAAYADEYNTVFPTVEFCRELRGRLDERLPLSIMTRLVVGDGGRPDQSSIGGTPEQIVEQLRAYEGAGVTRVMLQHLAHEDLETVELIGREVIPAVA